ncbi:hypothetical protein [Scatolibacter rhodanostii]|uniref:hypothetical protein n=1 Tax=Scatolibacter rhodanostii TaxID=2014781 RepID=UPI000C07FEDD|nr:hypothetical protein [Scatolibacter rhodanostii]
MKIKRRTDRKKKRIFVFSFTITISFLILISGLILVDFQGRKMSTGDKTPPISIVEESEETKYLHIYSLGIDKKIDVSTVSVVWKDIRKFLSLPE